MHLVLVMLGGAVGAGLRHLVGRAALSLAGPAWPWGTLTVNLAGGLAMGLLAGTLARTGGSENVRLLLGVGVLGGFTTFSSFSLDTVRLMESGQVPLALGYTSISVVGGLLATWAGLSLTRF